MGANTKVGSDIIFFDGVCNLCNSSVNFIIRNDKKGHFKFSSLQGNYASSTLNSDLIQQDDLQSLVLISKGKILTKSTAALTISKYLGGPWPLLYGFMIVPPFIRHFFYDLIAKNRYKLFGKKDQCMIPTPELKDRFID